MHHTILGTLIGSETTSELTMLRSIFSEQTHILNYTEMSSVVSLC